MLEEQVRRLVPEVLRSDGALVGEPARLATGGGRGVDHRRFGAAQVADGADELRSIGEIDNGPGDELAGDRDLVRDDVRQQVALVFTTAAIGVQVDKAEIRAAGVGDDEAVRDGSERIAAAGRKHRDAPGTRADGDWSRLKVQRVEVEDLELVAFDIREVEATSRLMVVAIGDGTAIGQSARGARDERDRITRRRQRVVDAPLGIACENPEHETRGRAGDGCGQAHPQRDGH